MSFYEYSLKMEAFALERVDNNRDIHFQSWLNQQIKATKKDGRPHYKKFDDFYNYEKELRKVTGETNEELKDEKLSSLLMAANK